MELVEGPTLADRIAQGAIPIDEALAIAKQIAEALEAAHEQGIIHRDLKPANIKLRPDGAVKVLDFGLAKAFEPSSALGVGATASPTVTSPAMMTGVGMLLGTAAYMAPEQARGKSVDKRADIWAFGCVLYEMLSSKRAFAGDYLSDTLANVLTLDADWTQLPPHLPPGVEVALRRCLQKDPRQRIGDAQSVRLALGGAFDAPPHMPRSTGTKRAPVWRRALPWATGLALGGLLVGVASATLTRPAILPVARFVVTTPATPAFSGFTGSQNLAISPDGTRIVYRASVGGRMHIYVRQVDQLEGMSLFTDNGEPGNPVVSPDGAWVIFAGPDATWRKVSIAGGPAVTISKGSGAARGASWVQEEAFVVGEGIGIFRVPAVGGGPVALSTPDTKQGEVAHSWPEVLPGGNALLFTIIRGTGTANQDVAVLDLTTRDRRILLKGASRPRYSPTGHLIYGVGGTLMAVAFDPDRLQVLGSSVRIVEGVLNDPFTGAVEYAIAANGSLVYVAGQSSGVQRSLVWVDRNGREEAIDAPPRAYTSPRISPDGARVALNPRDEEIDIWIWDFARKTLTRLTSDPRSDRFPVWSPDGGRIAFSSARDDSRGNPFWQAADGSGNAERLADGAGSQVFPSSFSPDGTRLLVYGDGARPDDDVGLVHLPGDGRVMPLLRSTMFSEQNPEISPDGRWMAYNSEESGRNEVYVRPFPDVERGRWQVSTTGGTEPMWARSGRELFFRNGGALMAAPLQLGANFAAGTPRVLFQGAYARPPGGRTYDVSPDGRRFLMMKEGTSGTGAPQAQVILVQNWLQELKRLVPTK
jgi:serine/threonine-protein kinase